LYYLGVSKYMGGQLNVTHIDLVNPKLSRTMKLLVFISKNK